MNHCFAISLVPLAALLLAGSAVAQTIPNPNPTSADNDRADRHCTAATLSANASAPCSDDVLNDRLRESSLVPRSPQSSAAGNGNSSTETSALPSPGNSGTASTGAMGTSGAGPSGTSLGTSGMPTGGTLNSGTPSITGATGAGTVPATGAARAPVRR